MNINWKYIKSCCNFKLVILWFRSKRNSNSIIQILILEPINTDLLICDWIQINLKVYFFISAICSIESITIIVRVCNFSQNVFSIGKIENLKTQGRILFTPESYILALSYVKIKLISGSKQGDIQRFIFSQVRLYLSFYLLERCVIATVGLSLHLKCVIWEAWNMVLKCC